MIRRLVPIAVSLLLFMGLAGCSITLRSSFNKQCAAEGWSNDECQVYFYYGVRLKFTRENSKGGYDVYYAVMPNQLAASIIKARLDDLDYVLDYKNKDWAKYIKEFGLREELEREEKVFKAIYVRLQLRENHNNFKDYMGESSYSRPRHLDDAYDASKIFVEDVLRAYPFTSAQIDEARANGTLKEIERLVWFSERTLGRKEPDPNDPDDSNKFIWKPVKVGIEFVSYKILDAEQPRDSNAEYVEGTRLEITEDGKSERESKPALRLFVPSNGYGSVLVVDKDREGAIGFLLPDFVEKFARVTSAQNLMTDTVLSMLFYEPEQSKRVPPKDLSPITVEIAPVGKNKVDVWETNLNGWTVPLKYKNELADNYSIDVKVRGSEKEDFDSSKAKQVEYIKKIWDSNGNVVEHYKPKPPYNDNLLQAQASGKRLVLVMTNGEEESGYVTPGLNKFVQDKPYSIVYTQGEKRWMIRDEDGDGRYEKKREMFESNNAR